MAGTEVVLGPGAKVGMLDGVAFGKAGAHEVLSRRMHANLGRHGADQGNLVGHLGGMRQVFSHLEVCRSFDGIGRSLGLALLGVEGVNVAHATLHIDKDDALSRTEACHALSRLDLGAADGVRKNRKTEGCLGSAFHEVSSMKHDLGYC